MADATQAPEVPGLEKGRVDATSPRPSAGTRVAVPLASVLAVAGAGLAGWTAVEYAEARWIVGAVVALVWCIAGFVVARRTPTLALGPLLALVGLLGAAAVAASAAEAAGEGGSTALAVRAGAVGLLLAALFHLSFSVPDGHLDHQVDRGVVAAGYLAGVGLGLLAWSRRSDLPVLIIAATGVAFGVVAVGRFLLRCRHAPTLVRARLQWIGWGVVVAAATGLAVWGLDKLLGWPSRPGLVTLAATALVPIAFIASTFDSLLARVDRLLVHTFVAVGLVLLVGVVYFAVVIGLGRFPDDQEQAVLGLSMVAAAIAAVLALPARRRLEEMANQRVYGERTAPDDALRTFAGRMSRVVPMDELLLQLAESLKKTMNLTCAEVWTGSGGFYERLASVPDRGPGRLELSGEELTVVARAHVSGNAWVQVWMPSLLEGRRDRVIRVASVAHLGELLGLFVVERATDAAAFGEEEDQVLTDLARQVGLALHNVRLDSALQESLDELEERNAELAASRLRIVTAADESRRLIERNLHDGAQQHLVAMAVKLGLARQLVGADQTTAETILEELRTDVQTTLTELRELAHGIYPPLLRDRGLGEALRTAANRAVLPVDVRAEGVGRHSSEMEAAVYFCCLEAMQNAGKYAGEDAHIVVTVVETADLLTFEVADDGPGFDPMLTVDGHGFVNMRDRVGAIGGELVVGSSPAGTHIIGRLPIDPADRHAEPTNPS